jgi:nitrogenase subunit NifH
MTSISAAIMWPNGKAYFFQGANYVRYDVEADRVDDGYPMTIRQQWPGLFDRNVGAAVEWPNGKAYFFQGADYVRYDVATDRTDGGFPQRIVDHWPGLIS